MKITVVSQFTICLCLSVCLCNGSLYDPYKCEKNPRSRRGVSYCSALKYKQNRTLCQTANLNMTHLSDSDQHSITVKFNLNDTVKYKDCFPYFDIYLINRDNNRTNRCQLYANEFSEKGYSHTFKEVSSGLYDIRVVPCYTKECCTDFYIHENDLINMTSYSSVYTPENPKDNSTFIFLVIAVPIGIILSVFGMYNIYKRFPDRRVIQVENVEHNSSIEKIIVYILHYYDDKDANKQKVNNLKDFLTRSSLYERVNTIEDELPSILNSVHKWLDDLLNKRTQDGRIQKIILIDSEEEDEEGDIENLIFNDFMCKVDDNLTNCQSSYDNLFVVQLDGISGSSDRLKNIVRRHRFQIPKHLIDLCINICSVPESHVLSITENLKEIYEDHPINKNCN